MSLTMMVYLIGLLQPFSLLIGWCIGITAVIAVGYPFALLLNDTNIEKVNFKIVGIFSFLCIVFSIVQVAIPTEKTAYMMVAAYATQKVYEAPETAKIQEKVLTLINQKLDSFIDDATEKAKK